MSSCCETPTLDLPVEPRIPGAVRTVALVGPPNSGKSTLFNRLTGLRQKVANYPGVTVEQRIGRLSGIDRSDLTVIDLPGIYSLSSYSEDTRVALDVLHGEMPGTPAPDSMPPVTALNGKRAVSIRTTSARLCQQPSAQPRERCSKGLWCWVLKVRRMECLWKRIGSASPEVYS